MNEISEPKAHEQYYDMLTFYFERDAVDMFKERLEQFVAAGYPIDYQSDGQSLLQRTIRHLDFPIYAESDSLKKSDSLKRQMINILLDHGADVNATNKSGENALTIACGNGPCCLPDDLFERIFESTEDLTARGQRDYSAFERLLNKCIDDCASRHFIDPNIRDIKEDLVKESVEEYFPKIKLFLDKDVRIYHNKIDCRDKIKYRARIKEGIKRAIYKKSLEYHRYKESIRKEDEAAIEGFER